MRTTNTVLAILACTLLASGCRTINRSRDRVTAEDIPFETAGQPSRIARSTIPEAAPVVPDVRTPDAGVPVPEAVAPAPVAPAPEKPVVVAPAPAPAKSVRLERVTAERSPMDTTPYEAQVVKSASEVGKPGSYVEQVIPENGGDQPLPIVSEDGLTGSTGRHVPAPVPAPEPVPVVKQAPAGAGVYVVQPGDILGRIAIKHGVSRQAILDANPSIKDPNKLKVGQKLRIPARGTGISDKPKAKQPAAVAKPKKTLPAKEGFTVYTVKKGDILGRIAIAHKTTVKALVEANGITDPKKLREGSQIYVPVAGASGASGAASAPAPAPAEAKPARKTSGKSVKVIEAPAQGAAPDPAAGGADSADDILKNLGIEL